MEHLTDMNKKVSKCPYDFNRDRYLCSFTLQKEGIEFIKEEESYLRS